MLTDENEGEKWSGHGPQTWPGMTALDWTVDLWFWMILKPKKDTEKVQMLCHKLWDVKGRTQFIVEDAYCSNLWSR